jgi:hypothetical protein
MACATFSRLLIDQKSRFCTQNARGIFATHEVVFVTHPTVVIRGSSDTFETAA